MDEDSFDPRSWAKPRDAAAEPPAKPLPSPPAPAPAPAPAAQESRTGTSLPSAWSEVVGQRTTAPSPPASSPRQAPLRGHGAPLAWAASAVLLLGGGAAAWLTRTETHRSTAPAVVTASSLETPKPEPGAVERTLNLGSVGELDEALRLAGIAPEQATAASQAAAGALSAPGEIRAVITLIPQGQGFALQRLRASYRDGSGAVVAPSGSSFAATRVAAELTRKIKVLHGELDTNSFYSSAVAAGLLDTLVPEFINAFSFDFNLAADVSPGDTFEVAYEQSVNPQGEPVGQPQLLFASLTTPTKSKALYRYQTPDGKVGWYDGNGGTNVRSFMRTPVDGARITSNFGMRFHPVLHYTRLHAGVDFGVPIGTPVYASADGVVIGAHPTVCGGNMAVVQHDNGWVTRYFHLSHFAPGLYEGERVKQGFTLGLSGVTGTCTTGPHLHYELRINGQPVDPMSVPMSQNTKQNLDPAARAGFLKQRDRVDVARAQQAV